MMLLKLAWRNIWRNKRRSALVMISAVIGLVAIILYNSLSLGMMYQMLENQVGAHVSHLQIHKKGFNDNKIVQNHITDRTAVFSAVKAQPEVAAFSERALTYGILSSAYSSSGIYLVGIDPATETDVSTIKKYLVEGAYPSGKKHEILIGKRLAEKLDVGLGDKLVAMASTLEGNIGSDVFRIVGIFSTFSSQFDMLHVYIAKENAQEMLGFEHKVSEFAILLNDADQAGNVQAVLQQKLGADYEVLTYKELLPLIIMQFDIYKQAVFVFYVIIGMAMIFGIINTMLMSVFERVQEFGVLMAIGMKNKRLFTMIMLEALLLGICGTIVGMIIGYLCYWPLAESGLDLRAFSDGLNSMGLGAIIYPELTKGDFITSIVIVPIVSLLGAIYPAIKAVRLQPITAIRHV